MVVIFDNMDIITKPKVEIAPDILKKLQECFKEEGQVIVHCISGGSLFYDNYVRIWKSTYLYDHTSDHVSELVHIQNISLAPEWTLVPAGTILHYSLIFTSLPKDCTTFDLEELISQPGRFSAQNIQRNKTDVYYIRL